MWAEVRVLHDQLGYDGMSSDETDTPSQQKRNTRRKVVRRVRKAWVNPIVSVGYQHLEELGSPRRDQGSVRGNIALDRIYEATRCNDTRQAVAGLPKNWYDTIWWKSLGEVEQHMLDPQPEAPLPDWYA
jgi:hypothetical protein